MSGMAHGVVYPHHNVCFGIKPDKAFATQMTQLRHCQSKLLQAIDEREVFASGAKPDRLAARHQQIEQKVSDLNLDIWVCAWAASSERSMIPSLLLSPWRKASSSA
jgi:hypothetical protein